MAFAPGSARASRTPFILLFEPICGTYLVITRNAGMSTHSMRLVLNSLGSNSLCACGLKSIASDLEMPKLLVSLKQNSS